MKEMRLNMDRLLENFHHGSYELDNELVEEIVDDLASWGNVFIACDDETKFLGNSFAFKLIQLKLSTYIVEDACLKEFERMVDDDDCIFIISENGEDELLDDIIKLCGSAGAKIYALTSNPKSRLGLGADELIIIDNQSDNFFKMNSLFVLNCITSNLIEFLGDEIFFINLAKCITVG